MTNSFKKFKYFFLIILSVFFWFWSINNITYSLNLSPILLNKIQKQTSLYLIKDTNGNFKLIKKNNSLINSYPQILDDPRIKYNIIQYYPWISNNDVNFWYSIKNSAKNHQLEVVWKILNRKNILNNFYYTYPLIWNNYSSLTKNGDKTYIRNNINDLDNKNKDQYPFYINKSLLDNYWKIYNLNGNYDDNIYAGNNITKILYYYDLSNNKVSFDATKSLKIYFSDNYLLSLAYNKNTKTVGTKTVTIAWNWKIYNYLNYQWTWWLFYKLSKQDLLNMVDKGTLYSPTKIIEATWSNLDGAYIQQSITKKSYNILPWSPLIPITKQINTGSDSNLYFKKWKDLFDVIINHTGDKIVDINLPWENTYEKFSKTFPTYMFWSENEIHTGIIIQKYLNKNRSFQYQFGSSKKYNIYSILNEYWYNFLTQWNIKPIYWTLKYWPNTATNPSSLIHNIFYVKNYNKKEYIKAWMVWITNTFIWKGWWFVDAYKLHNNSTKWYRWAWYKITLSWAIYNITYPAVVSSQDVANWCSNEIIQWISAGSGVVNCTLTLNWNIWIEIKQLNNIWLINPSKTHNYQKIKIKIKVIKQSFNNAYNWILYYINFWKVLLNNIKDVKLISNDKDINGNNIVYTFQSHSFVNKLLPSLKKDKINKDSIWYLLRNNFYSQSFSNNYIQQFNAKVKDINWNIIIKNTWLYWYPLFIRQENNTEINPISELYNKSKSGVYSLKVRWTSIPFWVNNVSNILVDNFINTDALWADNKWIYHDLMFYTNNKDIDFSYRFNWNQIIKESDFDNVINHNFIFTKDINGYSYSGVKTFFPKAEWNKTNLKTYNSLLKTLYTQKAVNYIWLDNSNTNTPDKNKYYKIINNYIFSEIYNNEIKKYYEANNVTYNPIKFFKRIFSYGHIELSYLSNITDPLYTITQNESVLQSQKSLNIDQLYDAKEKDLSHPISYGNDLYKYNNLENFTLSSYQNISSISNLKDILSNQLLWKDSKHLLYGWMEHDLDDHWGWETRSSMWYNVLMTNWILYPFLNTLVDFDNVLKNTEILLNPWLFNRNIEAAIPDADTHVLSGIWTTTWPKKKYVYQPYYNWITQLSKRSKYIANKIINSKNNPFANISINWLYANKLAIINSYIWEGKDINNLSISSIDNNKNDINADLNSTSADKKQLYLYKWLPLTFLFTSWNGTTDVVKQSLSKKLNIPVFWYNYTNNKWIIIKDWIYSNVLKFNNEKDISDFNSWYNHILNNILDKERIANIKAKNDCKDMSNANQLQCLKNKIMRSNSTNDDYFIYKWTTDSEKNIRKLIRDKQLSTSDINNLWNWRSCSLVWNSYPTLLIPKYIPSKSDWTNANWKLMLVQEGIIPFTNGSLIKCTNTDSNKWILLISSDVLLPSNDNNKVYFIPQNSNVNYLISHPIDWLNNPILAKVISEGALNKIFWAAGNEETNDMSKIVFNKFDNANVNGLYYQIFNNIEWNFDKLSNINNIKYKINNIVTYNFYDSNLNNINGFLPSEGSTYYMALSSAKKYGIWTTTIDPLVKNTDWTKWIYDYTSLFWIFGSWSVNNLNKFFVWTKSDIEKNMINPISNGDTKAIIKTALWKLLAKLQTNIEKNNKELIINRINAILLDKKDFKDLYGLTLDPWSMFIIIDVDINDLDNWDEHLAIPYILTWGTVMKDFVNNKYIEYIPYKFDILPSYENIFKFWEKNFNEMVDNTYTDCIDNNKVCIWDYNNRFKNNILAKSILSNMITIKWNYVQWHKNNAIKDQNGAFTFNFTVQWSSTWTQNQLILPYSFNNVNWYEYKKGKKRYITLNNWNNIPTTTYKEKELNTLLKEFYKTFNFVYYKINYKSSNVKINLDKNTNNNFTVPYWLNNNTFNSENNKINNKFISDEAANDSEIIKSDIYNNIFSGYTNWNGFNYNKKIIDNGKIKWLIFNLHDKIFNLTISSWKGSSNLKNYIDKKVNTNKKGLEWKIDKDTLNDLSRKINLKWNNYSKFLNMFTTLYIPFNWSNNIVCKASTVYSQENNPDDKAIMNWVYTTINGNNGKININGNDYDWEITNSIETLKNWIHRIKLYIKNIKSNGCNSITLSKINISSENIADTWTLIISWQNETIKTNDIIDISNKHIVINKGDFISMELDLKDVNISNYKNPKINIFITYTTPNSSIKYNTNQLNLIFKWKPLVNNGVCDKIKCELKRVSPLTNPLIDLTNSSHTNIKYQLECNNNYTKDINKIKYTIKYSNTDIYPSFINLDSNNSFSDTIFRLKQWQSIKWFWGSNDYNTIDDKLFIINSIKAKNINLSTTINWTYDVTMEDGTSESCSLNSLVYKVSMNDSNAWNNWNSNKLKNYNECYITDNSKEYNTTPYNIQGFLNWKWSSSFIKSWYLYLKFYKLQQNNTNQNISTIPTYRFNTTNLLNESWNWWWVWNWTPWGEIGEYNKIVYKAEVKFPWYITPDINGLIKRITTKSIKIENKKSKLWHLLNWYHIKVTRTYWSLKTNSKWIKYCDYSSLTQKIDNYNGYNDVDNVEGWKKPNGSDTHSTSTNLNNCLKNTDVVVSLYLNTELYWLSSDHETPKHESDKVYDIKNTNSYNHQKAGYTVSTYSKRNTAQNLFKNNPYAFFDQIINNSAISSLPFIELWIPININKPKNTWNTTLKNLVSWNQLLSNDPIVCKSNLDYEKIGYKWVDTSKKINGETLYVKARRISTRHWWYCTWNYTIWSVWHVVNLNWYGSNYYNWDINASARNCYDSSYKLRSGVNVPSNMSNVSYGSYYSSQLPWNPNYQIVLKQEWPTYSISDTQAVYSFYPTILSKGWTQYVWVYNIDKADSKQYNFMSNNKTKEIYWSVITDNNNLNITTTNKSFNSSANYILPLNKCYNNTTNNQMSNLSENSLPDERWYCVGGNKPLFYGLITDDNYNQEYTNEKDLTTINNNWLLDFPSDKFKLYIYNAVDNNINKLYIGSTNNANLKIKNVGGIFFTNDISDLSNTWVDVNIVWNIIKSQNDKLEKNWSIKANNLTLFVNWNLYIWKNVSLLQSNLIVNWNVIVEDSNVPLTIQWYIYIKWSLINKRKQVSIAWYDRLTWIYKPSVRIMEDPSFELLNLPFKDNVTYLEK